MLNIYFHRPVETFNSVGLRHIFIKCHHWCQCSGKYGQHCYLKPYLLLLWQETNISQESLLLLIKVVAIASRCRKTANVLISDRLREVLFVIGAHMWLIFSSRLYVFLITSLPFDCIWLTSLHPTEEEDLEASQYDREMTQLYWTLMFSAK